MFETQAFVESGSLCLMSSNNNNNEKDKCKILY